MAQLDVEDEVYADLTAFVGIDPATVYHESDMPLDEQLPTMNGSILPHVIIHPGSPSTASVGTGIIGPEKDPIDNYFILEVVAPNRTIVRQIGKAIDDRYLGLTLGYSTKFKLGRTSSWTVASGEAGSQTPRSYHRATLYRYLGNL
jgi:hypothetical protein